MKEKQMPFSGSLHGAKTSQGEQVAEVLDSCIRNTGSPGEAVGLLLSLGCRWVIG